MKLQLVGILDRKSPTSERLYLRAVVDVNLSFYVVFDTTYLSPDAISNEQRHAFWFPSMLVKAGDHIVLFTGPGTQRSQINPDGTTTHFFYWGLRHTIWNNTGDCAVVFEVNTWETTRFE